MLLDPWPGAALEAIMLAYAGGPETDVGCHVRALLARVRELEDAGADLLVAAERLLADECDMDLGERVAARAALRAAVAKAGGE